MTNKPPQPGEQFDAYLLENPDCYIIEYPHGRARRYVPKPRVVYHDCVFENQETVDHD